MLRLCGYNRIDHSQESLIQKRMTHHRFAETQVIHVQHVMIAVRDSRRFLLDDFHRNIERGDLGGQTLAHAHDVHGLLARRQIVLEFGLQLEQIGIVADELLDLDRRCDDQLGVLT